MTTTEILTKTLSNGALCKIVIVPDASPELRDVATTLSWWLEVTVGDASGLIKAHPHEIVPIGDRTHALTLPPFVGPPQAKVIGLTTHEAKQIDAALEAWVEDRKAAKTAAHNELATRARAAAPGAETFEINDPHGVPGVGETWRLADGRIVTGLRTWQRHYAEDGLSFGAAEDSGTVYHAEVRAATSTEAAPVLAAEERQRTREVLRAEIADAPLAPAEELPVDIAGLLALPAVSIDLDPLVPLSETLVHLRVDRPGGRVWILRYNGADGDDWGRSNCGAYIVRRLPLTGRLAELLAAGR